MDKTAQSAMEIILHAGDARLKYKEALDQIALFNIEGGKEKLKEAQIEITKAHKVQTDAIQGEARGEQSEYSLLFAHAQDTLMTIYSEINIAKQLIKIFESYEKRIIKLENRGH
ncbi:PTS lactose/cellobiose transporter subunit IIA [Streptococcus anginosus]|uniref:PTS lactose/cellobiose transporter subunit IIA n=1 Tax=Streptococcus anginosus TaxID=1328 RepID=UPI0022E38633|nr:PTS lactose/cellobiose transporter subunit IIA [Streptococcus anginosus]